MSEHDCSRLNNVVQKFVAAMVRSAVTGEQDYDAQNDVAIDFAAAASTDDSGIVLDAGE